MEWRKLVAMWVAVGIMAKKQLGDTPHADLFGAIVATLAVIVAW